ncbi:hypothetical protein BDN70DRAFT_800676 [Pholiota conissans]|uniref:Phosphatidylglycerol/phosphatidylinositol transfer protein n=1 Tax=Pholiota conissans TaxID=109636 RepID=A0A9P6CXF0_9AGAR|nr:hypothetical protein BDN70DRAFT_800676 [Pholiota conissans]
MYSLPILIAGFALASVSAFVVSDQRHQQFLDSDGLSGPARIAASWSWDDCGSSTNPIQITSIVINPDPPATGQDLTVTVEGFATEVIEEGAYAYVTVKVGPFNILQKKIDICEEARKANVSVQCPIEKGTHIVIHTASLPKEIPKAKYGIAVEGYTVDDDSMLCLKFAVNLM